MRYKIDNKAWEERVTDSLLKNYTEIIKCADKAESLENMKRLFDAFIHEVIFDGERFLIVMKTTDEPLDPEKRQKEEATRKKFELLRFGDPIGNRTRVTAVKGRCLDRLTIGPHIAAELSTALCGSGSWARTNDQSGMNRVL